MALAKGARMIGFAVRTDKQSDFIGKQACIRRKADGRYPERLVNILLQDPEPLMIHHEIVLRDGKPAGNVRSASYGHTLGASVGLAMVGAGDGGSVDAAYLRERTWEVDIAGRIYAAEVSLRPFYDPDMARIKA